MAQIDTEISNGFDRDDLYYFDDGDCVLQVENHLFNLHRFILRRNSGFFRNLFLLPQQFQDEQEGTDQRPILCYNESVEAFRAWCWVLYAGLQELVMEPRKSDKFTETEFVHIGSLAHKYECDTIEKWARQTLCTRLGRYLQQAQPERTNSLPPARCLEYLIQTSVRCDWPTIKTAAEAVLLKTCTRCTGVSNLVGRLRSAIDVADSLNDKTLKAKLYYTFLCSLDWNSFPSRRPLEYDLREYMVQSSPEQVLWDSSDTLTDAQKLCIYRGFLTLTSLQKQLYNIPGVDMPCQCKHFLALRDDWESDAQEVTNRGFSFKGPKEFLEEMRSGTLKGFSTVCSPWCGAAQARRYVIQTLKEFDVMLVDIFWPRPSHGSTTEE